MQRVTPAQRAVLDANYGKDEKANEMAVKALYKELGLEAVYQAQEDDSFDRIKSLIDTNAAILPAGVFMPILSKIHNRDK